MKVKVKSLSRVRLFVTPWTVALQPPLSIGFSGQEYWSGLLFSSPGDLPDPGIKPWSLELQANSLPSEPPGKQHLNKFHPTKSIFVNSEPQEMWTEDGKWQLSFLSPFNSRTLRLQESANQTWGSGVCYSDPNSWWLSAIYDIFLFPAP